MPIPNFPDLPGRCPLEEPLRTQRPNEDPGAYDFRRMFKGHAMSRGCLFVFPAFLITEAGSSDRHEGRLERSISRHPVESSVAELTAIVRCEASSRAISFLPCQAPSSSDVMTLTDSSKASLLFFCGPSLAHIRNVIRSSSR